MRSTRNHLALAAVILLGTAAPAHGDSALESANQVRREAAEYNQELRQDEEQNNSFNTENLENDQFDRQIDGSDSLLIPVPEPLWNDSPSR